MMRSVQLEYQLLGLRAFLVLIIYLEFLGFLPKLLAEH